VSTRCGGPWANMSNIIMLSAIIRGRAMSCCSLGVQTPAATGMFNAASDWVACYVNRPCQQIRGIFVGELGEEAAGAKGFFYPLVS
jgi:hypothetical protein